MSKQNAIQQIIDKLGFVKEKPKLGFIGIEFSIHKMYMVQLSRSLEGEISLRACVAVSYTSSRQETLASARLLQQLIKQARKQGPFKGNKIVTSLPANEVRMMSVAYQSAKGKNETRALLKSLQGRLEGKLKDYVIDYLPIRSQTTNDERLALVAIARKNEVYEYLESMRLAGLAVNALDIAPAAIKRLITTIAEIEHTENILVINFGGDKSFMTLISGQRLLFDQSIEFGEICLVEQIASTLDLTPDVVKELVRLHGLIATAKNHEKTQTADSEMSETLLQIVKPMFLKLVDEINRALIYAASETHGEPVKCVYLLGSIARWHGADKVLNKLINIPVTLPDVLGKFDHAEVYQEHDEMLPEMAVATGLALRGLVDHV